MRFCDSPRRGWRPRRDTSNHHRKFCDTLRARMQPLHIMLDFTRTRNANDPYGFQFGRQTYVCKVDGRGAHTITIDWNDELLADLDSLGSDRCDANTPQRVGNQLRDILKATDWPVSHQRVVDAIGTSPPRPVRVTVVSDAAEIYALPWELLALDSGEHLGLLPSVLVRYAWHGRRRVLPANATSKPGRILLAWSESHGVVPHDHHQRILHELASPKLSTTPGTPGWGTFDARRDEVAWVSYDSLRDALATSNNDEPVSILHLLCHGVSEGNAVGLGFHDGDGDGHQGQAVIHGGHLRELLGPHAPHLRVVVLVACHSGDSRLLNNELGSIAQNLHRAGIETVIASRMPLSIKGSVKFAKAFYGTLSPHAANAKDAAEHAFLQTRRAVAPSNDRYSLQLYVRPEEQCMAAAHRRPHYQDGKTQQRSEQLEEAYRRRETLREAGLDTADVNKDILALKRALREGGQLKAGDILGEGRYLLSRRVGHGGFAVVWEAWDTQNQEVVAIKVLHSNLAGDELRRQRFFRGARMMASLDHEAVVSVRKPHGHDGGYHYFVMEFVGGGNVDEAVMAGCLPPELAYGLLYRLSYVLAEVHEKGMVHRDIKPQNILLTDAGEAKLADFDLVAAKDSTGGTRTGALGTLLYAAPEMLDRPQEADARADVYGLGMTGLFVLHGGRLPYEVLMGDKAGLIGKLPVKRTLAKVLKKATATNPEDRYQNASELYEALLAANPAIIAERRKRKPSRAAATIPWRMAGAVAAVVVSVVIAVSDWSLSGDEEGPIASAEERIKLDHRVNTKIEASDAVLNAAIAKQASAMETRRRAFDSFDRGDNGLGEQLWRHVQTITLDTDRLLLQSIQALDEAMALDGSRMDVRDRIGDLLLRRAIFAEISHRPAMSDELMQRLPLYDSDGSRRQQWDANAELTLATTPPGARVQIAQYIKDARGRYVQGASRTLGYTPIAGSRLKRGSYLIVIDADNHVPVRYPIVLQRGEELSVNIPLPTPDEMPEGFIYIPAGRFLVGSKGNDDLRTTALSAAPLHQVETGAYIIARNETTVGEWIEYLEATSDFDKNPDGTLDPRVTSVGLQRRPDGKWRLTIRPPTSVVYERDWQEELIYHKRRYNQSHHWLRLPVGGIDAAEAAGYAAWLDEIGDVPRARLCNGYEWERAARGADDRLYTHGDALSPSEANIDESYGKTEDTIGPDEVGLHPASRSPFGIEDMVGNAYEWTTSVFAVGEFVLRGGGYFYDRFSGRVNYRAVVPDTFRDPVSGIRICASFTPGNHTSE